MTTNQRGEIVFFTLQLEFLVGDAWMPAVRYDSAHDEAHIDFIDPRGRTYSKKRLGETGPYNNKYNRVDAEFRASAERHRARFLRQLAEGSR